PGLGFY
uniref:Cyclopeptide E n=1 Tax=Annona cherimola TaxID=49314 RepID=CYCLE_ANNCH|nr:RecName: Full=Cyclopeptide E [Annona cherimola]